MTKSRSRCIGDRNLSNSKYTHSITMGKKIEIYIPGPKTAFQVSSYADNTIDGTIQTTVADLVLY